MKQRLKYKKYVGIGDMRKATETLTFKSAAMWLSQTGKSLRLDLGSLLGRAHRVD